MIFSHQPFLKKLISEMWVRLPNGDFWAWVSPENEVYVVRKLRHAEFIEKKYDGYGDEAFRQAFDDGWVRVIFEKFGFKSSLELNTKNVDRLRDVLKNVLYDHVKYANCSITVEWYAPDTEFRKFYTGSHEGKTELEKWMEGRNKRSSVVAQFHESSYQGDHKIGFDKKYNSPLYDLTRGTGSPKDIYTNTKDYMFGGSKADMESAKVIHSVKGKPDAEVAIYRGAPESVDEINDGDWVSLSKAYAKEHISGMEDHHIITKLVPAKQVVWDGNDLNEFAYSETPF